MEPAAKVIVVTGAGGALGRALARRFCREGAELVLADLDAGSLELTVAAVKSDGGAAESVSTDVTDPAAVEQLVQTAVARYGRLDVLINNAGVLCPSGRLHHQTASAWRHAIDVNLMGTVYGTTFAVEAMRPRQGGTIINTASVAGLTAWSHSAPYGATKAAVIHLTRVAALEYAADGIRVNCVCPGAFASGLTKGLPKAAVAEADRRHPLGAGVAEDLVGAFSYLASDDARWTTGAILTVDGGYSLP